MSWIAQEWSKVGIAILTVGKSIEWIYNAWEKLRPIEEFVERRYHERRHNMISISTLADLPKDLALLAAVMPKIQASIPLIQKTAADISQAYADQKNPAALVNDLNVLLADLNTDLSAIASLFPKQTPTQNG